MSIELSIASSEALSPRQAEQLSGLNEQTGNRSGVTGLAGDSVPSVNSATVAGNSSRSTPGPQELNKEQMAEMAEKLQEFMSSLNRGLEFSVDEDSGRNVIKVIARDSGDIIRQYPSEEVLDLVANLSNVVGNLVDSKV